jgi:uncharacterized protein
VISISDHPLGATFPLRIHAPGFPVGGGGFREVHTAFLDESRTRGHFRESRTGNPDPRAARTAITGTLGDALKISLSAPPLDGRANLAVVDFLSEIFSVPRSAVQLVAGERSRNKVIRIAGRTAAELQQMLRVHFTV